MIRLLDTITTSRLTLPAVCIYALLMSLSYEGATQGFFWYLCAMAAGTYFMLALNNTYSLIRIYSRMVSTMFLALSVMCPFLSRSIAGDSASLLFIAFFFLLFRSYQDRNATGSVMYAFLCLGLISLEFAQTLFFLPLALVLLYRRILSGNRRTLSAALIGFFVPYWIWAGWCGWNGSLQPIADHVSQLGNFAPPLAPVAGMSVVMSLVFIFIVTAVSIVHCLHKSYADKIKTRMLYDTFIWADVFFVIFLLLQPQHYHYLLRFVIVCSSPIIAHFFALERNKPTAIFFIAVMAVGLMLTVFNTWMQ